MSRKPKPLPESELSIGDESRCKNCKELYTVASSEESMFEICGGCLAKETAAAPLVS